MDNYTPPPIDLEEPRNDRKRFKFARRCAGLDGALYDWNQETGMFFCESGKARTKNQEHENTRQDKTRQGKMKSKMSCRLLLQKETYGYFFIYFILLIKKKVTNARNNSKCFVNYKNLLLFSFNLIHSCGTSIKANNIYNEHDSAL